MKMSKLLRKGASERVRWNEQIDLEGELAPPM